MKRKLFWPVLALIFLIVVLGVFGATTAWLSLNRRAESQMNMSLQAKSLILEGLHAYQRKTDDACFERIEPINGEYFLMDDYDPTQLRTHYELILAVRLDNVPDGVTAIQASIDPNTAPRYLTTDLVSVEFAEGTKTDIWFNSEPESDDDKQTRDTYIDSLFQSSEKKSFANADAKQPLTFVADGIVEKDLTEMVLVFRLNYRYDEENLNNLGYVNLEEDIDMFDFERGSLQNPKGEFRNDENQMVYHRTFDNGLLSISFQVPDSTPETTE